MRSLLVLFLSLSTVCHISAIHVHDARVILQPALQTFTQAVHAQQAPAALPACTPAQEQCIANGQAGQSCDASAGCQKCPLALAGYTCQPTTRCLSSTPATAVIAYPIVAGYTKPTTWAVGGQNNCAVTADCYFNQQACMAMGQDDNGDASQDKCSGFALRAEYLQQECQFCVASVSDGVGTLTSKDCTYTPKAGCTDNSQQPPVTRSGTCPGSSSKPSLDITPAVSTTTTTTTTTAPQKTTATTTTTQAPTAIRKVSSGVVTVVSMVSMFVTGMTVALLA